jgi:hypothetical protein
VLGCKSMYNRHLFLHMEEVHISEVDRMSPLSSSFDLWSVAWRQGFDESVSALPYSSCSVNENMYPVISTVPPYTQKIL